MRWGLGTSGSPVRASGGPGCGEGNVKLLFCAGWVAALTHEASIQQVRGGCRTYSSFESILSTKICGGDEVQLATVLPDIPAL